MTENPSAKERAQEAASTASDESRHVADVAKQEAGNVASEATAQARQVMGDAMTQVNEQSKEQKDRLAGTLRTFGDDLESMTSQASPGMAADLARQASSYARNLSDHLQSREPGELLDDVRQFARRRPGAFLLGALAAGVVVGRLARGTADGIAGAKAVEDSRPTGTTTGTGIGTTTGTGTATGTGTVPAATPPTYPGAPAGAPYVPDPLATPDTHGHDTGVPTTPSTTTSTGDLGGSGGLR
jgi:hypothetical protein